MPKGFADKLKPCVGHRSKFGRRCLGGRRKKWIQTVLGTVTGQQTKEMDSNGPSHRYTAPLQGSRRKKWIQTVLGTVTGVTGLQESDIGTAL